MKAEILKVIGQLQYEISILEIDEERLTGVDIRTEELKGLVEKLTIPVVVGRSEQLLAFKKWEAEKCKLPWDANPEQIIEQYISQ